MLTLRPKFLVLWKQHGNSAVNTMSPHATKFEPADPARSCLASRDPWRFQVFDSWAITKHGNHLRNIENLTNCASSYIILPPRHNTMLCCCLPQKMFPGPDQRGHPNHVSQRRKLDAGNCLRRTSSSQKTSVNFPMVQLRRTGL